jgi:hypothetical protein
MLKKLLYNTYTYGSPWHLFITVFLCVPYFFFYLNAFVDISYKMLSWGKPNTFPSFLPGISSLRFSYLSKHSHYLISFTNQEFRNNILFLPSPFTIYCIRTCILKIWSLFHSCLLLFVPNITILFTLLFFSFWQLITSYESSQFCTFLSICFHVEIGVNFLKYKADCFLWAPSLFLSLSRYNFPG